MKNDPLLDINELCRWLGGEGSKPKSKSFIWNLIRSKKLPKPIRLGHRTVRWRQSSVERALKRISAR